MAQWSEQEKWSRKQNNLEKIKHTCKCGHIVYIPKRNIFIYCSWCNKKVFQNERCKFEYNLFKSLGKVNNNAIK